MCLLFPGRAGQKTLKPLVLPAASLISAVGLVKAAIPVPCSAGGALNPRKYRKPDCELLCRNSSGLRAHGGYTVAIITGVRYRTKAARITNSTMQFIEVLGLYKIT